jgi:methionyl-tRNA formyltransferase
MGRSLPLRVLYAGTSLFAVPALRALAGSAEEIVAVVTRPDRPAGRGRRVLSSPVHQAALDLGLPVRAPEKINAREEREELARLAPDLLVVAAYGQILRARLLDLPRLGCVNLHASLLPRWRGAAPVAHALLAGDRRTGVTLMRMDAGLDTGPMLARVETAIDDQDDRGRLTGRLAELGAGLLLDNLPRLAAGELRAVSQPEEGVTHAPPLEKTDGRLDWTRKAEELARRVRAFSPEPGAFTTRDGRRLLIRGARPAGPGETGPTGEPGTIGAPVRKTGVPVACGGGTVLWLQRVQPAGRGEMDSEAAARGRHLPEAAVLR